MHPETAADECAAPGALLSSVDKNRFQSAVRRLHTLFNVYVSTCPVPIPAPGLIVTPDIRTQCERYLPIAEVRAIFNHLYTAALAYPPILSSTPFHNSMSWADTFAALPPRFQLSANPARLLELLFDDSDLLTRFLFASFLPNRFYGCIDRYPEQRIFVGEWLKNRGKRELNCLDAACGTGEDTYGLALFLSEAGFSPEDIRISGWTLEPLEVWCATNRRFPHDCGREVLLRGATAGLFQKGYCRSITFSCQDLLTSPSPEQYDGRKCFDLILCNGLLGGPIIHKREQVELVTGNLVHLLAPGGMLLAADNFHGGWKQKCPQTELRASFEAYGLKCFEAGEGFGGLKPD
jgi:SAM-dependent methyltransferase